MYYFHTRAWLEGYTKEELLDYIDYINSGYEMQDNLVHVQKDLWKCMDMLEGLEKKMSEKRELQELEEELEDAENELFDLESRVGEIKSKLSKYWSNYLG